MQALALLVLPALAPAQGDFAQAVFHEPLPLAPDRVAVGDVDGDGDLDGYGSLQDGDVLILGAGDGSFAQAVDALPATVGASVQAVLVDVDGDGDLDVANAHWGFSDYQDRLLVNDGTGVFGDATGQLPADPTRTQLVVAGDVDGDGSPDLWFGKYVAADVLLTNDGAGSFSASAGLAVLPAVTTRAADLADIDGDGDLDGIWSGACSGAQAYRLLENDGTGVFADVSGELPLFPAYGDEALTEAEFVDLEGDGDADLWLLTMGCTSGTPTFAFWENDGAGSFSLAPAASLEEPEGYAAYELADFDGDSDVDVVLGIRTVFEYPGIYTAFGANRLWRNDGAAGLTELTGAFPDNLVDSRDVVSGDFDQDGDVDFWSQGRLYLGNGLGAFGDGGGTLPVDGRADRPVGDVNGDGWLDVFADDELLWLGDGTPYFTALEGALPEAPVPTQGGAFGDVDGDGDQDLLVLRRVDGDDPTLPGWFLQDDALLLNDGTGVFTDVTDTHLPQGLGDDRGVNLELCLVDIDGDGDLDVVQAALQDYDGGGGGVEAWVNDGNGVFSEVAAFDAYVYEAEDMVLGDVDADGDVDVVVGEWPYGVQLFLSDGAGSFAHAPAQLPAVGPGSTRFLDLGDVDGDGDPDLVVGRIKYSGDFDDVFGIWLNDGAGVFTDSGHPFLPPFFGYVLFDVDGDGDLDLATGSSWLENDGTGLFSPAAVPCPPVDASSTLADVDGDGDVDVLAARTIASGLEQHLAWRVLPALGKTLTLDVFGPTRGSFLLFASAERLPTPIPTVLGAFSLDPTTILDFTGGALDVHGAGKATYRVPTNPSFAGLTVWWQAIVGLPPRTTNLEPTTLTVF